jgi:signal transduction histidine kinase
MSDVARSPGTTRLDPPAGGPAVAFTDVDIRTELRARPRRAPNYQQENLALAALAREMAANPRNMLHKLVEVAADLCEADAAGISLLDGDVFRWEAVAGTMASARGGTMARTESPCGVCIDENTPLLMRLPHRYFSAVPEVLGVVEALLIPFHHHGSPVGTVWIVTQSETRKFDSEDERIVSVLAQFASSAWQLWKSYEAAADASNRKSDFLALISHELRNPVAALTTAAALARQRLPDGHTCRRQMDVITRQCRHITRLVDDLLDMARAANRKLELQKREVDVGIVVRETVDATRQQIEDHHHHLTLELDAMPLLAEADPVRVAQVVVNLVDNAAKYTPDGGTITVAVHATGGQIEISVRDTGDGLPSEQLTNIFNPFIQLASGNGRIGGNGGGLGLGLPLVRTLAELHGGSVRVTSDGVGQGSCFTVSLPACRKASDSNVVTRHEAHRRVAGAA